jgi:indole-3-glycerol phosphate synthase/phosphoribosylanthranilate isomerase
MVETLLDHIVARTWSDLTAKKQEQAEDEVIRLAQCAERPRDFYGALAASAGQVRLIAELKRASPSRGLIRADFAPDALARSYEQGGAAAISVLTEPHFFQGSPAYLRAARAATSLPLLRKDFIVDRYQVYEARAMGADALLLICALLDDARLCDLLQLTQSLGMEALVEIHDAAEARRAVAAGSRIIGINNRDLRTFRVHMETTRALRDLIPADRLVVSESGIFTGADVRQLGEWGVQAALIGEAIMRHADVVPKVRELATACRGPRVKMCGMRTPEQALAAGAAGADFIGLVFAPSRRQVTLDAAREIVAALCTRAEGGRLCPHIVGVFVNPDAGAANRIGAELGLDYVQLSGDEPPELCRAMARPVVKALRFRSAADLAQIERYRPVTALALVDTPDDAHRAKPVITRAVGELDPKGAPGSDGGGSYGGTGRVGDWQLAHLAAQRAPILLAGGLTPENVAAAVAAVQPWGVDVSSGIEVDGIKSPERMQQFALAVGTWAGGLW